MSAWLDEWLGTLMTAPAGVWLASAVTGIYVHRAQDRRIDIGATWQHVRCRPVEDQSCITPDYGQVSP